MPLPQQVIEQLGHEPSVKVPGWSMGILLFSGAVLAVILVIYAGLAFGFQPYLNSQIAQTQSKIAAESQKISSSDAQALTTYYSQITNLSTLVASHVIFSQVLTWLESNTEANVYYGSMSFGSGNQVTLSSFARTQADVNQQIAIFESSPNVSSVSITSVMFSATAGMWSFNTVLTLKKSLFLWPSLGLIPSPSSSSVSVTTTTSP